VYTEHFRRRARTELGFEHTLAVSYSQDHEGYLLTPEDWLLGGYEIDINQGGPLQGEHIMEQLLVMAEELTTDVIEHPDPCGQYLPTPRRDWTLPNLVPDPRGVALVKAWIAAMAPSARWRRAGMPATMATCSSASTT
jgi:hypothetical protein